MRYIWKPADPNQARNSRSRLAGILSAGGTAFLNLLAVRACAVGGYRHTQGKVE